MHTLFVIPAYAPFVGGAQTFCRAIARRLAADGHRVTVLTSGAGQADDFWERPDAAAPRLARREALDGVEIVRLPLRYPWPAPYRFGISRRISHRLARLPLPAAWAAPLLRHFTRFMPPLFGLQSELPPLVAAADLIITVDAGWDGLFVQAGQAALARAKPLIIVPLIHTGSPAITGHFQMPHQKEIYGRAAAVLALSQPEAELLTAWGVDRSKVHCLAMGVEPETGAGQQTGGGGLGAMLALPRPYILFLGAATFDKGAQSLAEAILALARRGEEVAAVYAGPQQHRLAVFIDTQPPAARAILRKRLHLLGVVDEAAKRELLAGCAALALPSRVDSFGIVILEAWQQGKPVVAADVGGPAALITPEVTGLLTPFGDVAALADAIERLCNEAGLAARLGAAGHAALTSHFTWDNCYDALHQIFASLRPAGPGKGVGNAGRIPVGSPDERH